MHVLIEEIRSINKTSRIVDPVPVISDDGVIMIRCVLYFQVTNSNMCKFCIFRSLYIG